jgi:hypothetical protein
MSDNYEKCYLCGKPVTWDSFCEEHEAEFRKYKEGLTFRYGDEPNEWAIHTSFILSKHRDEIKMKEKKLITSYQKLVEAYEIKSNEHQKESFSKLLYKIGELQATCEHKDAHWIQEVSKVGIISSYLVKRCYNCNSNIEKLDVPAEVSKELITKFDIIVEEYKNKQSDKT